MGLPLLGTILLGLSSYVLVTIVELKSTSWNVIRRNHVNR